MWSVVTEKLSQERDALASEAIGEKSVVTNTNEAGRKHMEKEAPDEFDRSKRHRALLPAVRVVFPVERYRTIVERRKAAIGDGNAVRVTRQILEHLYGTTERRLGVDDPLGSSEGFEKTLPFGSLRERCEPALERKFAASIGLTEQLEKPPTKESAQDADGKKEALAARDPERSIRR